MSDAFVADYLEVARKFKKKTAEVNAILGKIEQVQGMKEFNNHPSPFVCIFDSSGTGKTQLAATAAILRPSTKVVYLYTGQSTEDSAQAFYRQHIALWTQLKPLLSHFSNLVNKDQHPLGAGTILYHPGQHPLIQSVHKIFFGTDEDVTVAQLRQKIKRHGPSRFLVFLDEIPPAQHNSEALVLRNFLRAIGVAPILMSTHSGSHNAIPVGRDSREAATFRSFGAESCRGFPHCVRKICMGSN